MVSHRYFTLSYIKRNRGIYIWLLYIILVSRSRTQRFASVRNPQSIFFWNCIVRSLLRECLTVNISCNKKHSLFHLVPFTGHCFMQLHNQKTALGGIYQSLIPATAYSAIFIPYHLPVFCSAETKVWSYRYLIFTFITVHGLLIWIGRVSLNLTVYNNIVVRSKFQMVIIFGGQ